jgi:threonylcarbamoyladenosine tRNA methylthiotransferase MtaB
MQLKNKTFCIVTLGCKVNLFESNNLINQLIELGCKQTPDVNKADLCIINTCCVTNKAVSKSKYFIQRAIRSNKTKLIAIVGCLSQLEPTLIKHPKVGIILGSKYKDQLVDLIKQYANKLIMKVDPFNKQDKFEDLGLQLFKNNTRAFLKIQDGCDYMCSYCIIPFVRGRQRSLPHTKVLKDIQELVQHGYHEIVLTGVNTAGYHDDANYHFYELLKDINEVKGDFRIRISSIEPFQINHQIIGLLASNPQR